jgi:hypothetical protein
MESDLRLPAARGMSHSHQAKKLLQILYKITSPHL